MKLSKLLLVCLYSAVMLFYVPFSSIFSQGEEALKGKKILYTYGGWNGHQPVECKDIFVPWLESCGATVITSDSLGIYKDSVLMNSIDLIIQAWTQGSTSQSVNRSGQIMPPDLDMLAGRALLAAVRRGVGLAGWHGGTGDAFRNHVEFQFMVGGQWVAHPGNTVPYSVQITDKEDPVTKGLSDFNMNSEQYYMHVDPNVKVLATTTYSGDVLPWIEGCVIPVAWKKTWGNGRVFYSSLGHIAADFNVPEALEIMKRGICWAALSLHAPTEPWLNPIYPGK